MKVTTCPLTGCGRTVGIAKPLGYEPASQRILRTAPHKRPDGAACIPTAVEPDRIREVAGDPTRAERNRLRNRRRRAEETAARRAAQEASV